MQQIPEIFRQAQHSAFRKRLAAHAQPLDIKTQRRIEFARLLFEQERQAAQYQTERHVDIPKLMQLWSRVAEEIKRLTAEGDPAGRLLLESIVSGAARSVGFGIGGLEAFASPFLAHDFFIARIMERPWYGPILAKPTFCSLSFFFTALAENPMNRHSIYAKEISLIDLATLLERAVFKINLYRYDELEPAASALITEPEFKSEGVANAVYKRRSKTILQSLAEQDEAKFSGMIDALSPSSTREAQVIASMRISLFAFASRFVSGRFQEDEVGHVLNLLNALAQSAVLTDSFIHSTDSFMSEHQFQIPLANLASLAFGDCYSKLEGFYGVGLDTRSSKDQADEILLRYIIPLLVREMGYQVGSGPKKAAFFFLSRTEDEIKAAAKRLLDSELRKSFGRVLEDVFDMGEVERIATTTFVTREQLPVIAAIWKERYGLNTSAS